MAVVVGNWLFIDSSRKVWRMRMQVVPVATKWKVPRRNTGVTSCYDGSGTGRCLRRVDSAANRGEQRRTEANRGDETSRCLTEGPRTRGKRKQSAARPTNRPSNKLSLIETLFSRGSFLPPGSFLLRARWSEEALCNFYLRVFVITVFQSPLPRGHRYRDRRSRWK